MFLLAANAAKPDTLQNRQPLNNNADMRVEGRSMPYCPTHAIKP